MTSTKRRNLWLAVTFLAGAGTAFAGQRLVSRDRTPPVASPAPAKVPATANCATRPPFPQSEAADEQIAPEPTLAEIENGFRARPEGGAEAVEQAKSVMQSLAKELGTTSVVKDVDCRGGACRVSVTHRDASGPSLLMSRLSERPLKGFGSTRVVDEGEGKASVVYLEPAKEPGADEPESLTRVSGDFAREPRDPRWADHMTTEIQSSLGAVVATGTAIDAVECQSTLCKVTISHANEAARQAFFATYSNNPIRSTTGARVFSLDEKGTPKTVMFISRGGSTQTEEG